jgi:hypothetical protein
MKLLLLTCNHLLLNDHNCNALLVIVVAQKTRKNKVQHHYHLADHESDLLFACAGLLRFWVD